MKKIFTFYKKADKTMNRILIPKVIIEKYGREFMIDVMEDETIILRPVKGEKKERED